MNPGYQTLYQVNTRVWLNQLSGTLNRIATLDDIPDSDLDQFAEYGFDWIWFLSVWKTGKLARQVSLNNPEWKHDFELTLTDLQDADIGGSGFAIADYSVSAEIGGIDALKRLRLRLAQRGLKLMLDFVPNHMGPDHQWVNDHPDYFIRGTKDDIEENPQNWFQLNDMVFAYGRDPYFSGWPDTVQLDYSNPSVIEAMKRELLSISEICDGLRCDMAMLILPDVFQRTWGHEAISFWPESISEVREIFPDFCFMAEVYWDMEWRVQQEGFDYAYDKRLYDRLVEGHAKPVREHFYAGREFQDKLARFLENHDEQRAAKVFFQEKHKASAIITFMSPGLKFFHQGQLDGRKLKISPHLVRAPEEISDKSLQKFYLDLLMVIRKDVFRKGTWILAGCTPAWDGNNTWDSFLSFAWEGVDGSRVLISVNFAPHESQCYVRLPFNLRNYSTLRFKDLMGNNIYERDGNEILLRGLYLDLPGWGYHVFEIRENT